MNINRIQTRVVIFVAVVAVIVCSIYLSKNFLWAEAFSVVLKANVLMFLAGAGVSIVAYWVMRSLRWAVMLEILGYDNLSFRMLYIATAYSLGLSMVMPLQSGEVVKVEMLKKSMGLARSDGYFALAIERLLDILVVSFVALICVTISAFDGQAVSTAITIVGCCLGGGLLVYVLVHWFGADFKVVKELKMRLAKLFQNPRLMLQSLVYTFLGWGCVSFGWWMSLGSVDIFLSAVDVTGLTAGMTLVNVLSFVPGSVGVSEVGISVWLEYLNVPRGQANAGALMLRAYGLSLLVVGVLHWVVVRLTSSRKGGLSEDKQRII